MSERSDATGPGLPGPAAAIPELPDTPRDPVRSRGRYVFRLDGEPIGIDERFVLGDIAPGVVRARTTRVLADPVGRLESDVRVGPRQPGRPATIAAALRWTGSASGAVREASAELTEDASGVSGQRVVDGAAYGVLHLAGRLNALAHVVAGPLVLAALGGTDVVEPDVTAPRDPSAFLGAVSTRWTTSVAGPISLEVDGEEREATSYLWRDERTGLDGHVVVDPGGLLLRTRVTTADGLLEVVLMDVTGPWPAPISWFSG